MTPVTSVLLLLTSLAARCAEPELPPTEPFEAPKYGITSRIPKDWTIAMREQEDRVFVAVIPQKDFDRPGVAACELRCARGP